MANHDFTYTFRIFNELIYYIFKNIEFLINDNPEDSPI